jgi:hypothetical protein
MELSVAEHVKNQPRNCSVEGLYFRAPESGAGESGSKECLIRMVDLESLIRSVDKERPAQQYFAAPALPLCSRRLVFDVVLYKLNRACSRSCRAA